MLLYLIFPPTLLEMFMPQNLLIYCNHVLWEDLGVSLCIGGVFFCQIAVTWSHFGTLVPLSTCCPRPMVSGRPQHELEAFHFIAAQRRPGVSGRSPCPRRRDGPRRHSELRETRKHVSFSVRWTRLRVPEVPQDMSLATAPSVPSPCLPLGPRPHAPPCPQAASCVAPAP